MILDVIICTARKILGNFRPSVPQLFVSLDDQHVLLLSPLVLFYIRIKVIVPAFPALLADPPWQGSGNLAPIHSSILFHHYNECVVFLISPRALDHRWVQNFLPTM